MNKMAGSKIESSSVESSCKTIESTMGSSNMKTAGMKLRSFRSSAGRKIDILRTVRVPDLGLDCKGRILHR